MRPGHHLEFADVRSPRFDFDPRLPQQKYADSLKPVNPGSFSPTVRGPPPHGPSPHGPPPHRPPPHRPPPHGPPPRLMQTNKFSSGGGSPGYQPSDRFSAAKFGPFTAKVLSENPEGPSLGIQKHGFSVSNVRHNGNNFALFALLLD